MRTIALLLPLLCHAASPLEPTTRALPGGEAIRGGAVLDRNGLVTWGASLRRWTVPSLESTVLAQGPFGEGGCTVDLDGDGVREVVTVLGEGLGRLVRFAPPKWTPEPIDTSVEMHDCLEATLFGRRGVLMIQRGMQVRFHERARDGRWSSRDIYSIYTPSYQTGLALADIDRDGLTDILCGNYWIRSPRRFELPWRLFAINTWSEQPDSASFRLLALGNKRLAATQAHAEPARIAIFDKPADPTQQWPVRVIEIERAFAHVHGLALWNGTLLAGERNGTASRLLSLDPVTASAEVLATGHAVVAILPLDSSAFVTLSPDGVTLWRQSSRR